MDKKLQKEILTIVKGLNEDPQKGTYYKGAFIDVLQELVGKYFHEKVLQNIRLLLDENKIEKDDHLVLDLNGNTDIGWLRVTSKGYQVFDPWYKKFWNFFNNDFAKILSVIATILGIIATYVSLQK
ncbi:MAG: hypothetical protein CO141_01575 [Candidatus Moranbacteria bacterium CG_4_9_14_3_um_filter_42_9]|nr:MAG: hypothetical protein CO141_01575 [Candidatus Moranbacteria bacterium CG_4_9_14_3_um_filter_42_9]